MNEASMVVVMIESGQTLANVEEIAAVPGVDTLFISSNDHASSLGIPGELEHPKVREAHATSIAPCRKQCKHLGIGGLVAFPKLATEMIALGCR
ncbi:aldolase/citrate lyase family protein [Variovorax sp. HJSM1_2]|uniref:aldolase/citrate lyase family protein n=1 Tax=Variovorax sp. HJSM1_2 TaxID=3366263 RepID=UPI003BCF7FA8